MVLVPSESRSERLAGPRLTSELVPGEETQAVLVRVFALRSL